VCNFKALQFQAAQTKTQTKPSQQEVDYIGSNNFIQLNQYFFPFVNNFVD